MSKNKKFIYGIAAVKKGTTLIGYIEKAAGTGAALSRRVWTWKPNRFPMRLC